mgnify:CR=1 FL=1
MKEVLGIFQGKDDINIPPHIVDLLKANLPNEDHLIDVALIRSTLRRHKLSKYVDCSQSTLFAITGKHPPRVKREVEDNYMSHA